MKLRTVAAISLAVFLLLSFSTAQAQKRHKKPLQPLPTPPAITAPADPIVTVVVEGQTSLTELKGEVAASPARVAIQVSADITKVRIVNEASDVSVSQSTEKSKSVFVSLDLDNGKNEFNVIGYDKNNKIIYNSPTSLVIDNKGPAAPRETTSRADSPPKPDNTGTSPKDDSKKIKFKDTPAVSTNSIYDLFLNLGDLKNAPECKEKPPKCEFKYVVTVTHENGVKETRVTEFPILTVDAKDKKDKPLTAKEEAPKPNQQVTVELFPGENTISVVAKYKDEIKPTQSDPFKVTYNRSPDADARKVQFANRRETSSQTTYPLKINLANLSTAEDCTEEGKTKCALKYVITVKAGDDSKTRKVSILTEKKTDEKVNPELKTTTGSRTPLENQEVNVNLSEGKNTITVYAELNGKKIRGTESDPLEVDCNECTDFGSSINTRAIVGFEYTGASSTEGKQAPFLDFFFNAPFWTSPLLRNKGFGRTFSIWGNVKFANIPLQNLASISTFSAASVGFLGEDAAKPNKLTPSFNALLGVDINIGHPGPLSPGFLPGKSQVSFIASAGVINPLKPETREQIFKVPVDANGNILPSFLALFPEALPDPSMPNQIKNISFVSVDREKFYRQYYAGFRVKTYFYDNNGNPRNLFPAMVDLTIGQNEAITRKLIGFILKLDGSAPLPIKGNNFVYLFGGLELKLGRYKPVNPSPFKLDPQAPDSTVTNLNTIFVTSDRAPGFVPNRDVFRIGLGIDLFKIFKSGDNQ